MGPDILVLGGDYVHQNPAYIKPFFDELLNLKPGIPVFAVLGNHDHWQGANESWELMKRNGIHICDNKSWWVKKGTDSIKIGGVGDFMENVQLIDSTIHDIRQKDFCILISHNPDYLEHLKSDKVDLSLCGHTHGGQVTFFGLWAPVLPSLNGQKYRYGLKQSGNMQIYISSGFGTINPPVRFFAGPEIVLIELIRSAIQ
jgi:uncharacterized protein